MSYRMYDKKKKKRDGGELTDGEIEYFIDGFTNGSIPDYQASALLMAIFYRGMTEMKGSGTFTGEDVRVFMIFVSKYETARLRAIVLSHDPNAFIVETTGVRIDGHFQKKLE